MPPSICIEYMLRTFVPPNDVEMPNRQFEEALDGHVMFDGSSIEGFVRIEESDLYL